MHMQLLTGHIHGNKKNPLIYYLADSLDSVNFFTTSSFPFSGKLSQFFPMLSCRLPSCKIFHLSLKCMTLCHMCQSSSFEAFHELQRGTSIHVSCFGAIHNKKRLLHQNCTLCQAGFLYPCLRVFSLLQCQSVHSLLQQQPCTAAFQLLFCISAIPKQRE